jgi:5-methyltetrahydropteroyltriglutamate--homocysteine methyltransferase
MAYSSNLGLPRIGSKRELKKALEAYWSGKISEEDLDSTAREIRTANWQSQREAGLDFIPSNDFSFYDHVLDMTAVLGAVPERFGHQGGRVDKYTYFAMARGVQGAAEGDGVPAMEMTKWFDTNYHYIVPEFTRETRFSLASRKPVDEFVEAKEQGVHTRPVLIGPVSYLLLGKGEDVQPISLLEKLLPVYEELFGELGAAGADWLQIDEPFLTMDLADESVDAYHSAYERLSTAARQSGVKLMIATYFNDLRENSDLAAKLPVNGLHIDLVAGKGQLETVMEKLSDSTLLSIGVVNGRNIWKTDLNEALSTVRQAIGALGNDRVVIAPSCSMLHAPVDLDLEKKLDNEIKEWLAYARQKVQELRILKSAVTEGHGSVEQELEQNAAAMKRRQSSERIHNSEVKKRAAALDESMLQRRSAFQKRKKVQSLALNLPAFPTTTIGSFPQTQEIRKKRAAYRKGELDESSYRGFLMKEIEETVRFQERVGLDVLVHGEPERNDMVEYFGEQLEGYVSTQFGWVQSYGSRCVKPPIIFGDVSRPEAMTTEWSKYAQSLTDRPMKGMLTGPVTMLHWSFVRDDQPESETCKQIALALRDEVRDLESSGIRVIQMDEPALREGLPLRREDWEEYLEWAVESFKLASSVVTDQTQIHTHMCYAEFNDIIEAIADLDADVISLESSRSKMELLDVFRRYQYPNDIGPGVYDIHSPRVPSAAEMRGLLEKAVEVLSPEQVWVNPDCGLKTRKWEEVEPSLRNMVAAAQEIRSKVDVPAMG